MGFRYRSTIRILPGLRVNLSKSGASLSVGRRGATVKGPARHPKIIRPAPIAMN